MKRVLVLGSDGMAGHVMAEHLSGAFEIVRCDLAPILPGTVRLDVTDFPGLAEFVRGCRPDAVVNCVGMLIGASRERTDLAILINSYLPHFLSRLGIDAGFKLIHISTDCVFSGLRGGYAEDDFRDGDTPYARTKALGEVTAGSAVTIRTSIVGPELKTSGSGLLHWFLGQSGALRGYSRTYWSGVTTLELAKAAEYCINSGFSGLVNLAMRGKISKHELLLLFKEVWGRGGVSVEREDGPASDKSLVSVRSDFGFALPGAYRDMLAGMRDFMDRHREWYGHYGL